MKRILIIMLTIGLFACGRHTDNTKTLQDKIDSLQARLDDAYKPGFGEFMSSIQVHHAKLWFAA